VRTGAEALVAALEARGVRHALGIPGTQGLALWEALRRSSIRPVLTTHELAATFMASGYYRASGRLAAVVTIPGPGFTHSLSGLAEALHDSAALLHVVGGPPPADRPFRFQALDQAAVAAPLAKAVREVRDAQGMESATLEAIDLALSGEPGPVVLQWAPGTLEDPSPRRPPRPPAEGGSPEPAAVEALAERLTRAERPLLLAGQGCAGAPALLRAAAEALGAPVVTSLSGRGALPEDHRLAMGFDPARGELGTLNQLIEAADLVLVLGCKLSEAGTSMHQLRLRRERLVQVDAGPAVVGATYPVSLGLVARVEAVLGALVPRLAGLRAGRPGWPEEELQGWRERLRALPPAGKLEPQDRGAGRPRSLEELMSAVARALPSRSIVVTDSGLHQTLVRRHLQVLSPRGLIAPSDYQSMGFGLPAAIGARLAAPDRPVLAVIGDGGFAMSGLELLTAVREELPLVVLVFNDRQLNRIRLQQLSQYGRAVAVELHNPDFAGMVRAMGARHVVLGEDAEAVLAEAFSSPGVTVAEAVLGDGAGLPLEQAKGLARGAAQRALGPGGLRGVLRRLRGRGP
jgi:acetolactate synthase-1/2/3 large subunit